MSSASMATRLSSSTRETRRPSSKLIGQGALPVSPGRPAELGQWDLQPADDTVRRVCDRRVAVELHRKLPLDKPGAEPLRVGGVTGGPPRSSHARSSCSRPSSKACRDHVTATRPSGTDRAPYLAALVISSCSAMARVTATLGCRRASGPFSTKRLTSTSARRCGACKRALNHAAQAGTLPVVLDEHVMGGRQRSHAGVETQPARLGRSGRGTSARARSIGPWPACFSPGGSAR